MKCYRCGEETFASVEAKFAKQEARIAELEAQLGILHQSDGREALLGVTAERVEELRALAKAQPNDLVGDALRDAVRFYDLVRKAWEEAHDECNQLLETCELAQAEAQKATEELLEQSEELTETHELVDQLRGELRRYEPSDAVMYQLLEKRTIINEAAERIVELTSAAMGFEPHQAQARAWLERHRNSWNINPRPIPEPEQTIRALHTVIDEGRQLFDQIWEEDNGTSLIKPDTWAAIDEWRQRVLVTAARETVSGEVAKMIAVINNCDELDARRVQHIKDLEAERTALIESCKRLAELRYHFPKCETEAKA